MARPPPKIEPDDDAARASFMNTYGPHRLVASVLRRCVAYLFPPVRSLRILSHLAPLLVCLSLIPLLLFFSLFSGWYIWKNIPVAWQTPVYLQYGDSPSPYAELSLPPLSTAQPYDVSLQLALPATEANFALGNFMTTLSLSTPSNKTLVIVNRPVRPYFLLILASLLIILEALALPPKPATFPFSVPRLIHLEVPLLSSYVPAVSRMNARINLGRRDGWKSLGNGEARELSVWNAVLKGATRRHGIRGLVSRFPLVFALAASAAFFSLSVITLTACILPAIQWRLPIDETPGAPLPKEERPGRVRKRLRRSVASESRATGPGYKSEDVPVDMPSALAADDFPLKRRRSRMSDVLLDSET